MKSLILTTAALGLTCAAPTTKRWPVSTNIITPTAISAYNLVNGAITYKVARGVSNFDAQKTTLVQFSVPSLPAGSTCSLKFYLDPADTSVAITGSGKLDIFSSLAPAPAHDVDDWGPPGNQRDQPYGRLVAKEGEVSAVDTDVSPKLVKGFACPAPGEYGFEVVSTWGVGVEWDTALSGLYMEWA